MKQTELARKLEELRRALNEWHEKGHLAEYSNLASVILVDIKLIAAELRDQE